jgi:hypothetical protein
MNNKTPIRGFRVPDEEYLPAQAVAARKDETLTDVVRRAFVAYAEPCDACGALPGEPCFPLCIGLAAHDDKGSTEC